MGMLTDCSQKHFPQISSDTFSIFFLSFSGGAGKAQSIYRCNQSEGDGTGGREFILAFSFCACLGFVSNRKRFLSRFPPEGLSQVVIWQQGTDNNLERCE